MAGKRVSEAALKDRVAFLSMPSSYDEHTLDVDAIETHMSWVFLTDHFAYKLKKPVANAYLDFRSIDARRHYCQEEVRLNQRLARSVYLGVVPITQAVDGTLEFSGEGTAIDWLILMRRLSAAYSLEHCIRNHSIPEQAIETLGARLAQFYAYGQQIHMPLSLFRGWFAEGIEEIMTELFKPEHDLPVEALNETASLMRSFLAQRAPLFDQRVRDGRIVEGHGDLRAEHIYLESVPQVVDCIEFSQKLRAVDAAFDLSFLALDCERLGDRQVGEQLFDIYRQMMKDDPPAELIHFYQTYHACSRARIALWHLKEPQYRESPKWMMQAREWLMLAMRHARLMKGSASASAGVYLADSFGEQRGTVQRLQL